jgi:sugar lactone lactonase YvrE
MRTTLNHLRYPSRFLAARAWIVLLLASAFVLGAAVVNAQNVPPIVLSQANQMAPYPNGGADASSVAAGTSTAVTANGDVIVSTTYGGSIVMFNAQTGAAITLGQYGSGNAGAVALDPQGNLYLGAQYSNSVVKLPYANGKFAPITDPTGTSAPACTGTDSSECVMQNIHDHLVTDGYFGAVAMAFDAAGDLFVATNDQGATPHAIVEMTAADLYSKTPTQGTVLFQEPTGASPSTTGQLWVGAVATDSSGNLFFADSNFISSGSNENSVSHLYELPFTSGTGFATTPTTLYTFTPASVGSYDDRLDGVAVDASGTVYFTEQYDGVFAIPRNGAALDPSKIYGVSTHGGKTLTIDTQGNLYTATSESNGSGGSVDVMFRISVNSLTLPTARVTQTASATNVTVMDNNGGNCTSPPTITLTPSVNGGATTEFSAVITAPVSPATTTCATQPGGIDFPITASFAPAIVGERLGVLGASDGTNTGAATVSGVGQGTLVTLDPGVWTSYTTGFNTPYAIALDATGDLFIADPGAGKVFEIPSGSPAGTAPTSIGSFTEPNALAFDTNGFLWVADGGTNEIDEIANIGTKDQAQTTAIADSVEFGGAKLNDPSGLAFGPDGVLYISDLGNGRVVTFNPSNDFTAVRASGLKDPWGLAVDGANTLYVAETGGQDVKVYQGGETITSLAPTGVTAPWAVAVDASGSVLISDSASGHIVRVPSVGGTLKAANALTVETNPKSAYGLALDVAGNVYSTDGLGASVYAVNRLSGTLAFPTTDDTETSTLSIWIESAGNQAMQLYAPTKSGASFKLATASTDACGVSVAAGSVCAQGVEFDPAAGIAVGTNETGTVTLATNALNAPSPKVSLTGTTAAAPQSQTITFPNPFAKTKDTTAYGAPETKLTASASSGLTPVTFAVTSGPATIVSGDELKITGAGTVVVTASQAGNSTYGPASAKIAVTVNKAVLTFKANSESTKYGTPFKTFTYTITGFVNGDTKGVLKGHGEPRLTPTVTDTANPTTYLGALQIKNGTLTPIANYRYAFIDGNLTVEYLGTTKTPVLSPLPIKPFTKAQTVTITDGKTPTPGAVIYYTVTPGTKGKAPTIGKKDKYTGSFMVSATSVVEAVAKAPGYKPSLTVVGTYTIKK